MSTSTVSATFFEQKYREKQDPWNFAHSKYEQARYDAILLMLGARQYRRAFEPGCSVGELSARLAQRCDHLEAMDISATAVARAKKRCSEHSNVHVQVGDLRRQMPDDMFDLIVLSEMGYYFEARELQEVSAKLVQHLLPGGTLLAAHWLGVSADHLLGGDEVHAVLGNLQGLQLEASERHAEFRVDRWSRNEE